MTGCAAHPALQRRSLSLPAARRTSDGNVLTSLGRTSFQSRSLALASLPCRRFSPKWVFTILSPLSTGARDTLPSFG